MSGEPLYAIIGKDGTVEQVVVWDGFAPWAPSKSLNVKSCAADVGIGWTHDGKAFVVPRVDPPTKEQVAAQDAMLSSAAADKG